MKKLIFTTFLSFSFFLSSICLAQAGSDGSYTLQVPDELSSVVVSDAYLAALLEAKKNHAGGWLKLSSIVKYQLAGKRYFEFLLEDQRAKTGFQVKSAGSIVVSYFRGPMGDIGIESAYFKPPGENPGGGASVGNN